MFGLGWKAKVDTRAIEKAADKGAYKSFSNAAASIRKAAIGKIKKAPKAVRLRQKAVKRNSRGQFVKGSGKKSRRTRTLASAPGTPIHTRAGQARRAIVFAADKTGAVIGFRKSIMGLAAEAHEHGGKYKGATYPERPTMGPALEENLTRFAATWQGSIGS